MDDDILLKKLTGEHESEFTPTEEGNDDKGDGNRGDNSQDNSADEANRTDDSAKDHEIQSNGEESGKDDDKTETDKDKPVESDDSQDTRVEPVGEKKDANSRIRQLIEERKAVEAEKDELAKKLAEREEAERQAKELEDDPIYTIKDFVDSVDEDGELLTEREANLRFKAWESDYKMRQMQKEQLKKDNQATLINLQRETLDAFKEFPEFDDESDKYDEVLGALAGNLFEKGLIRDKSGNIIESRVNPRELLTALHSLRTPVQQSPVVTKVNKIEGEDSNMINSRQVNKMAPKYSSDFRGAVDKELDNLIKEGK